MKKTPYNRTVSSTAHASLLPTKRCDQVFRYVSWFALFCHWHSKSNGACPVCYPTPPRHAHIVGECERYKEERDALEELSKLDVCDMEEFGRLESSEKTIAILGDRWWPQTAKQDGDRIIKQFSM